MVGEEVGFPNGSGSQPSRIVPLTMTTLDRVNRKSITRPYFSIHHANFRQQGFELPPDGLDDVR
jgi:hypothetical protein